MVNNWGAGWKAEERTILPQHCLFLILFSTYNGAAGRREILEIQRQSDSQAGEGSLGPKKSSDSAGGRVFPGRQGLTATPVKMTATVY